MTSHVLVTGTLFRQPERKTSKAGKPYVAATLKSKDGDSAIWWKVIVFSESAGAELMRLADGDAASVQGALRVETYQKDGETKVSLTCIGDGVLALKPRPKESRTEPTRTRAEQAANGGARSLERPARMPDTRQRAEPERIGGMRVHPGERDDALDDTIPF